MSPLFTFPLGGLGKGMEVCEDRIKRLVFFLEARRALSLLSSSFSLSHCGYFKGIQACNEQGIFCFSKLLIRELKYFFPLFLVKLFRERNTQRLMTKISKAMIFSNFYL